MPSTSQTNDDNALDRHVLDLTVADEGQNAPEDSEENWDPDDQLAGDTVLDEDYDELEDLYGYDAAKEIRSLEADRAQLERQLSYAESALDTALEDREAALNLLARVVDPRGQDETLMHEITDYLDEHPGYENNEERIRREFPEAFEDAE